MAKVTGPLMSIDASGAFADTMVYAKMTCTMSVCSLTFPIFALLGFAVLVHTPQ